MTNILAAPTGNLAALAVSRVYLIDADPVARAATADALRAFGLAIRSFSAAAAFRAALPSLAPGCIVVSVCPEIPEDDLLQQKIPVSGSEFPIVAVTPEADVAAAVRAMKAGAADVLARPVRPGDLAAVVQGVLALMPRHQADDTGQMAVRERLSRLTRRERQVLDGMVQGEANKAIAHQLGISPRTVEVHRAKVMEKLACRNLPEIVRLALRAGMFVA